MALAAVRIQFVKASGAYRANEIAYFSPTLAQAIVDAGIGTNVDAIPAGTAHVQKGSTRSMAAIARTIEPITSEADRQLVSGTEAAPVE